MWNSSIFLCRTTTIAGGGPEMIHCRVDVEWFQVLHSLTEGERESGRQERIEWNEKKA